MAEAEEKAKALKLLNAGNDSWWYGGGGKAWPSKADALTGITIPAIRDGRTIGIMENGSVVEYWWKSGTGDADLVKKGDGTVDITVDMDYNPASINPVAAVAVEQRVSGVETSVTEQIEEVNTELEGVARMGSDVFDPTPAVLTVSGGAATWSYTSAVNAIITLTTDVNLTITSFPDGRMGTLLVKQDNTGGRKLNITATGLNLWYVGRDSALSTEGGKTDLLIFIRVGSLLVVEIKRDVGSVSNPEPEPEPGTVYTAQEVIAALKTSGADLDEETITDVYNNELSTFAKQNASAFFLPAVSAGKIHVFNNNTGGVNEMAFTRAGEETFRNVVVNKNNEFEVVGINYPMVQYEDAYQTNVQAIIDDILSPARASERVMVVDFLPSGYKTDGSVDYTSYIKQAVDTGRAIIVFPPFPLMVNQSGIQPKSNQTLYWQPGGELWLTPGLSGVNYKMIYILSRSNVRLINPKIRGDFGHGGLHSGSYEGGVCLQIVLSSNIEVYNGYFYDAQMDGIYMGNGTTNAPNRNVRLYNCLCSNTGRNGMSVISFEDLYVLNLISRGQQNGNPAAGVDIEPNGPEVTLNATFSGLTTYDNAWTGLQFGFGKKYKYGALMNDFGVVNIKGHFNHSSAHQMWISVQKGDSEGGRRVKGVMNVINSLWNKPIPFAYTPYRPGTVNIPPKQFGTNYTIIRETANEDNVTINFINPTLTVDDTMFNQASLKNNLKGTTLPDSDPNSNGLNWGATNINVI